MQNLSAIWVDANGETVGNLLHMTDAAILTDGIAAISTASNADWTSYWGGPVVSTVPAPVTAIFQTVRPPALLLFQCADGTMARVRIPAPRLALFLADQETIDSTDPTGVLASLLPIITSSSGSSAVSFAGGTLEAT